MRLAGLRFSWLSCALVSFPSRRTVGALLCADRAAVASVFTSGSISSQGSLVTVPVLLFLFAQPVLITPVSFSVTVAVTPDLAQLLTQNSGFASLVFTGCLLRDRCVSVLGQFHPLQNESLLHSLLKVLKKGCCVYCLPYCCSLDNFHFSF